MVYFTRIFVIMEIFMYL